MTCFNLSYLDFASMLVKLGRASGSYLHEYLCLGDLMLKGIVNYCPERKPVIRSEQLVTQGVS